MKFLNIHHILYTSDIREMCSQINNCKKLLHKKFNDYWVAERNKIVVTGGKLEFFVRFKKSFVREQYLKLLTIPKFRRSLTKFRISSQ